MNPTLRSEFGNSSSKLLALRKISEWNWNSRWIWYSFQVCITKKKRKTFENFIYIGWDWRWARMRWTTEEKINRKRKNKNRQQNLWDSFRLKFESWMHRRLHHVRLLFKSVSQYNWLTEWIRFYTVHSGVARIIIICKTYARHSTLSVSLRHVKLSDVRIFFGEYSLFIPLFSTHS